MICRPNAAGDVPFRSVASRLVKSLTEEVRAVYQLDVLRPATFDRLIEVLQRAYDDQRPYHAVHFDGHGAFLDLGRLFQQWKDKGEEAAKALAELLGCDCQRFSPKGLHPHPVTPGEHGYLVFENPRHESNLRLVDGGEMGRLLAGCGVPVLLLNACRMPTPRRPRHPRPPPGPRRPTRTRRCGPSARWPSRRPTRACRACWPCATTSTW